jgi:GntR family transcriptional regulator, transcriptional repressor for pyruvate dehydrogenase complex
LAAERATAEQVATLAEEVASMFASMQDPQVFLVHDINFHREVAAASGNPIVASLVEMVSALYYERRRDTAVRASERDLRDAAEMHRRIYQAIRARDADTARRAMSDHLIQASRYQAQEPASEKDNGARRAAAASSVPKRRARVRRRQPSI